MSPNRRSASPAAPPDEEPAPPVEPALPVEPSGGLDADGVAVGPADPPDPPPASPPEDDWTIVTVPAWTVSLNFRRSEEHTSELQSRGHLVCRLLLEKKK